MKIVMVLGFPRGVNPPYQGLFCGPDPHKLAYEGVFIHVLNVFPDSFWFNVQLWDCLGFRDTLSCPSCFLISCFLFLEPTRAFPIFVRVIWSNYSFSFLDSHVQYQSGDCWSLLRRRIPPMVPLPKRKSRNHPRLIPTDLLRQFSTNGTPLNLPPW